MPFDWLVAGLATTGVGGLMTTRAGGCSEGRFASMNLQLGDADDAAAVLHNRERLAQAVGAAPVYLRQVHGTRVVRIGANEARRGASVHEADAAVTTEPGVACTVLVADCLPVLFAAPEGRAVGAAHAGWRGLAAGVLEASVTAVCKVGRCAPAELTAWLGVSIGLTRFEVGADVVDAFGGASPRFVAQGQKKWLADLPGLAEERLRSAGVQHVSRSVGCTVDEPSRFFSYRRDGVTGRMAAAVWIER